MPNTLATTHFSDLAESGLTPEEQKVMAGLINAWNAWIAIDAAITSDELEEFRAAIHRAQHVLAFRAVRRQWPNYWQ